MVKTRLVLVIAALAGACSSGPVVDTTQVSAARVNGALPVGDPGAAAWQAAPEYPAALMMQDVTEPRLTKPGVGVVRVRALHDGTTVVFRLQWDDATRDIIPESGVSSDAAAVQFAVQAGADVPNAAMGEAGKPVEICYWKAVWQDDAERPAGIDRVAALYPRMAVDAYPFKQNSSAAEEMATRYAPALAAGNPITKRPQTGAVQELVAEGFGTSTVPDAQHASGTGAWVGNRWSVTIARPLKEGEGRANLEVDRKTYVAFAIWDGAERHTGGRKMRSGWVPLLVQGGAK
ncbi:MAG: ethylbenzene dehydrogenase-related protein [Vicinamibacterales bacterium]